MKALFEASQVSILNPLVNVLNEEDFDLCSFKAEIKNETVLLFTELRMRLTTTFLLFNKCILSITFDHVFCALNK